MSGRIAADMIPGRFRVDKDMHRYFHTRIAIDAAQSDTVDFIAA